jgi:CO/xanthine dehydrogenase Mo-binding subunit
VVADFDAMATVPFKFKGTYVATMAEVKVDKTSRVVQVQRVVCGQHTGEVINPEGVRLQIEGCITKGHKKQLYPV